MNEYDTSKMVDVLRESHGLEPTDHPEQASVLLLNTCSVREKAQEKVFSLLGRWRQWKRSNPDLVIGVGGCVASQEGAAIVERAPFVDLVFGPQTLHRLPDMLDEFRQRGRPVVDVSFPEIEKFDKLPEPRAVGATAFVSIMEGCSKYCSFCVVPYTRGEEISRPLDDVVAEILQLAEQGVKEVTLLGQNVNGYRGRRHDGETADLATLLHYVNAIDEIERIRFTTSHPLEFSDRLIQAYDQVPKLANYLHLPVQSGSDRVLALMKRGYTVLEYKQKIRRLRGGQARYQPVHRHHRRFSWRNGRRLCRHDEPGRRRWLRPVIQLHLQPATRYASGHDARRYACRTQTTASRGASASTVHAGHGNQRENDWFAAASSG